jgi:hypothetical protein
MATQEELNFVRCFATLSVFLKTINMNLVKAAFIWNTFQLLEYLAKYNEKNLFTAECE